MTSGQPRNSVTQPARDFAQSAMDNLVRHALVLADSTGHDKTGCQHIRSVHDFHIFSPGSSLSSLQYWWQMYWWALLKRVQGWLR